MAETAYKAKLLELARTRFNPISPAEEKLFEAAADAKDADCREGPEKKGVIRSYRLSWLCKDPQASTGISIVGAEFSEEVHLEWVKVPFPLRTRQCVFKKSIILQNAQLRAPYLIDTSISDSRGEDIVVKDRVSLSDGFNANGKMELANARIGGNVNCDTGHFVGGGRSAALDAKNAKVVG
jgi:hypothetical protein